MEKSFTHCTIDVMSLVILTCNEKLKFLMKSYNIYIKCLKDIRNRSCLNTEFSLSSTFLTCSYT